MEHSCPLAVSWKVSWPPLIQAQHSAGPQLTLFSPTHSCSAHRTELEKRATAPGPLSLTLTPGWGWSPEPCWWVPGRGVRRRECAPRECCSPTSCPVSVHCVGFRLASAIISAVPAQCVIHAQATKARDRMPQDSAAPHFPWCLKPRLPFLWSPTPADALGRSSRSH